jgi:hypothetical protein
MVLLRSRTSKAGFVVDRGLRAIENLTKTTPPATDGDENRPFCFCASGLPVRASRMEMN